MFLSTLMPLPVVLLRKFSLAHTVIPRLTVLEVRLYTLITGGTSRSLEFIGKQEFMKKGRSNR